MIKYNTNKKLIFGLLVLALLCPLGLLFPGMFHSGGAWGEWSAETVKKEIGYVPKGMEKNSGLWKAPVKDYSVNPSKQTLWGRSVNYFISGILGLAIIGLITYVAVKLFSVK